MKKIFLKAPKITGLSRSYFNYFFGEKEIKYLKKYLSKKEYAFIDVGANYGIYSFIFASSAKLSIIVEPIKECIDYIRRGLKQSSLMMINKLASNTNKPQIIKIPIENNRKIFGRSSIGNTFNNYEELSISSFKLDELTQNLQKISFDILFIKIDVEGHENEVLEGSKRLFTEYDMLLLIEIEKRHNPKFMEIYRVLTQNQFSVYHVNKNNLIEIKTKKQFIETMQNNINFLFKNF
jgi:FkbM family methyltransferase